MAFAKIKTIESVFAKYYTLRLLVYSEETITSNTSKVYVEAWIDPGAYGSLSSTASKSWKGTVGSNSPSGSTTLGSIGNKTPKKLFTTPTYTITHDTDGSKSIKVSITISLGGLQFTSGKVYDITASADAVALPKIARGSSISSVTSSVTVNGTNKCTVNFSPSVSSYTHKAKFSIGSYSYTSGTIAAGTNTFSYAIPNDWKNAFPKSKTGTAKVELYTYNGSTQVGDAASKTFTLSCDGSEAPTFNIGISDSNGYYSKVGCMLVGMSKLTVSATSISYKYGASIGSCAITIGSTTKTGTSTSVTEQSNVSVSGSISVKIVLTDSRGYSTTHTTTVNSYAYSRPSLYLSISRYKKNADGTYSKDDDGDYGCVYYTSTISAVGSNALNGVVINYESQDGTDIGQTITSRTSTGTYYVPCDDSNVYNFDIVVSDNVTSTVYRKQLSSAITIMDILRGGLGIAIGGVATLAEMLDITWNVIFRKDVKFNDDDEIEHRLFFRNKSAKDGNTESYTDSSGNVRRPHFSALYGGNASSNTSIGVWDHLNSRLVWAYDDINDEIVFGTKIKSNKPLFEYGTPFSDFECPGDGKAYECGELPILPEGLYQVFITVHFPGTTSSGSRAISVKRSTDGGTTKNDVGYSAMDARKACDGGWYTICNSSFMCYGGSNNRYYVYCQQNSGSSMTVHPRYSYRRVQ